MSVRVGLRTARSDYAMETFVVYAGPKITRQ